MRPIKLKMTAFGPYKNTEVIDFSVLEDNSLFVISGNTGAGKTTIFDGLCFALYGTASGQDRDNHAMLRSDFADDDTHTAVELEFQLDDGMYRILRQLGHIKQGNRSKTGEKYEFFRVVNDKEVPCVDRQIVSEINKKVEVLMGLTQDQFKQIVMLPQGEFRKLLTSETENKEEILRRLFKTEPYKQINERLKDKKARVEESFKQAKQTRDTYIQNISATLPKREESLIFNVLAKEHYNVNQIVSSLEKEILFYQGQLKIDEEAYENAYRTHDKQQKEFHELAALNERFEELDRKERKLKELATQKALFLKKTKQVEEAERASNIEAYEKLSKEWYREEKEKNKDLEHAEIAKKIMDDKFTKAGVFYEQEQNKQNLREEVNRELDRFRGFLPTVKDIDERKEHVTMLAKKRNNTFNKLTKITSKIEEKTKAIEEFNEQIKTMDAAVSQVPDKQQKLIGMRDQAVILGDFIKLRDRQIELDKNVVLKEKAFNKINREYSESEKIWLNSQASIIATHLHNGVACPVCGSMDHPNKALPRENLATKDQLDALKKNLDEKDNLYRNALANKRANASQLKEKQAEVGQYKIQLEDVSKVMNELVKQGKQLKEEVGKLDETREKLAKLKKTYERVGDEVKLLEAEKGEMERLYQEQKSSYETSNAVFKERLRVVPKEVRGLSELEKQISETEQYKLMLEKAWDEAQRNFQRAKEDQTKAFSNLNHAKKQLDETRIKRKKAETQFNNAFKEAKFDTEEAYQQAKMSINDQQKLKKDIDRYNQQLSTITQQVNDLKNSLRNKTRVDLAILDGQLNQLKAAYERAFSKLNLAKKYSQEALKLKMYIMEANDQMKKQEQRLETVTDLYDVIRGHNDQKVSFERYLQIEYLEQIIDASNQRLKRLSNGQFLLIRSGRQESHGRQSGLAFDVYDAYTGQTRDVKTLSGGEKFNTSLCLALGMSDVIQSFQGNVSIKTMFIDEGFGSLDEESLNKSIDTLIDLQQSGRTIGVISHVQELKEIFPAVLEVSKTKEGFSKTEFIIK